MKRLLSLMLALCLLAGCTSEPSSVSEEPESSSSQSSSLPDKESESSSESELESSTAQSNPAPSQPAVTLAWWQQELSNEKLIATPDPILGYAPCGTPDGTYWIYDDTRKVSWLGYGLFARSSDTAETAPVALILDSAVEAEDIGQPVMTDTFFEIVGKDDTKLTGRLYEQGVELTRSLPGQGYGDSVKLKLSDADLTALKNNLTKSEADSDERSAYRPAWLTMMRESRTETITFRAVTGEERTFDSSDPWPYYVYDEIPLIVSSAGTFTDKTSLPDSSQVTVTFNNGLVYNIYASETQLLVTTNDTEQGLLYTLRSPGDGESYGRNASGKLYPPTGKPVIYLYPEEVTDCTVTVDYSPFTYTYPTYNDGWEVTAYPDGRLINKADGTEHYYLFWEGGARPLWEFESGFVVKGSDTEAFLREKLAYLGLTPREYNDFITYWVPKMQNSPYNLITFAEEQYEELAPLTVTPKPDSVVRVHMVYLPLEQPIEIPEQELTPMERTGFTVVEWGGTDASYMKQ